MTRSPMLYAVLLSVLTVLTPGVAAADCMLTTTVTAWSWFDAHHIVLWIDESPAAVVEIPNDIVYPFSEIAYNELVMCDGGEIWVDGELDYVSRVILIEEETAHAM